MLAQELVARFHSGKAADDALVEFEARFRRGVLPNDMPEMMLPGAGGPLALVQVLKQAGLTTSTSEAMRMIEQGAVRANGERVADKARNVAAGETIVLQIGKRRFAKVTVT
jgi:tyrosyl-tRNA synthetase